MALDDVKAATAALEALNKDFQEYKATNDERLAEIKEKGKADPLLDEKLQKIDDALTKSQDKLTEFELALKRKQKTVDDAGVDLDEKAQKWADGIALSRGDRTADFDNDGLKAYDAALNRYLRKGKDALTVEESKALSVGSDPDGGYTVLPDASGRIVKKIFDTSPMRQYASIQTISTDRLTGVYDLEENAATWVGETATRSETDTAQIGQWEIPVHELQAMPKATQKLLDDSMWNMEAWLAEKVSAKFARTESTAFVTGDGVGKPRGFLDYASGTTLPGTIEQIKTGVNGGFKAAPDGGDTLIEAVYKLKSAYRANGTFFMGRTTLSEVRKLKDSNGAMIWQPGVAAGQPSTLLGYPVADFDDMPDIATGSLSIAFGDMRAAYQIVDRSGISVLRDPFTSKPHILFYSVKRVGGDVVDFDAIKLIDFSA